MDISLDLMYADLERLSSLYSQLASMQFTVDNPEMIVAKSLAFAMIFSLLIASMMGISNMYLTDYLSHKVNRWGGRYS